MNSLHYSPSQLFFSIWRFSSFYFFFFIIFVFVFTHSHFSQGHEKMVKSGALIGQRQNPTIWTGDVTGEIKVWSVGDFQLMHEFLAGDGLEKGPSAVLSLVGKGGYAWAGMGNGMIHRYHCVSFIVSLSINAHPDSKVNQIVEIEEKSWLLLVVIMEM